MHFTDFLLQQIFTGHPLFASLSTAFWNPGGEESRHGSFRANRVELTVT